MRSHKFLAGAVTGVALVLLVSGLILAGVGRQPTSAATGTPQTNATSAATSPSVEKDQIKTTDANDLESRMITPISDAEWNAAATSLSMSASDFEAAITGGQSVASLGAPHNVTAEQVRAAMVAAGTEAVNTAVQNGTITQADASTLDSGVVTAIADKVTHANTDTGPEAGTPTAGQKTTDGQKRALSTAESSVQNAISNAELSAMASTLGVTGDQLKTTLSSPDGVATLAASHHVTAQQLDDAMVAAGQQAVDQEIANGTVSQSDADSLRTGLVQLLAEKLSHTANATSVGTPSP